MQLKNINKGLSILDIIITIAIVCSTYVYSNILYHSWQNILELNHFKTINNIFINSFIKYIIDRENSDIYIKNNNNPGCHKLATLHQNINTSLSLNDLQEWFTFPPNNENNCTLKTKFYFDKHLNLLYKNTFSPCVSIKTDSTNKLHAIMFFTSKTEKMMPLNTTTKLMNDLGAVAGIVNKNMEVRNNFGWKINLNEWAQCGSKVAINSIAINLNALADIEQKQSDSIIRHRDEVYNPLQEKNRNTMNTNLVINSAVKLNTQSNFQVQPSTIPKIIFNTDLKSSKYQPLTPQPISECLLQDIGQIKSSKNAIHLNNIMVCSINPVCKFLTHSNACYLSAIKTQIQFVLVNKPRVFNCPSYAPILLSAQSSAPLQYNYFQDSQTTFPFGVYINSATSAGIEKVVCTSHNVFTMLS